MRRGKRGERWMGVKKQSKQHVSAEVVIFE
jgi:hypothetical protein